MAYNDVSAYSVAQGSTTYPEAKMIRPEPQSPAALVELSATAKAYAEAAGAFIVARDNLTDARERFNHVRDLFAKHAESEGI